MNGIAVYSDASHRKTSIGVGAVISYRGADLPVGGFISGRFTTVEAEILALLHAIDAVSGFVKSPSLRSLAPITLKTHFVFYTDFKLIPDYLYGNAEPKDRQVRALLKQLIRDLDLLKQEGFLWRVDPIKSGTNPADRCAKEAHDRWLQRKISRIPMPRKSDPKASGRS